MLRSYWTIATEVATIKEGEPVLSCCQRESEAAGDERGQFRKAVKVVEIFVAPGRRRLKLESDEDKLLAVVLDKAGVASDDVATDVHERVQSLGEDGAAELLFLEADDEGSTVELLVCELHQVDETLLGELFDVGGDAVEGLRAVVRLRLERDSLESSVLDGGYATDLDAVLGELSKVSGAEEAGEKLFSLLRDYARCFTRSGGGREGNLGSAVGLRGSRLRSDGREGRGQSSYVREGKGRSRSCACDLDRGGRGGSGVVVG